MPKLSDRDRILRLLSEAEGLSNIRIKTELNLSDDRYDTVRDELLQDNLIEKYVCRGGGIRLTRKGEKESPSYDGAGSTIENEAALYKPLIAFLEKEADEDGLEAVICATHALRVRGQWQNPDVTRVAIEQYHHLRKAHVTVTTYEVKQFPRWTTEVVYEAASHHRFSHEAYVVLEWACDEKFSLTDPTYRLDQLARECRRFGVGLATLEPHRNSYRLYPRLEPTPRTPDDGDVEEWLDYVFSRNTAAEKAFNDRMHSVQKQLAARREED
jgi:predicted transcriptional regulator